MSGELKDVDLAIRVSDFLAHTQREVSAYQTFLRRGGGRLLLAGYRRGPKADPLAEAFGLHFDKIVRGSLIDRWAAHPATQGLAPLHFGVGSVVTASPKSATPLAWLVQEPGSPVSGALVMGTMTFGKGKIVFLSSQLLLLLGPPQPFTDRLFSFLSGSPKELQ